MGAKLYWNLHLLSSGSLLSAFGHTVFIPAVSWISFGKQLVTSTLPPLLNFKGHTTACLTSIFPQWWPFGSTSNSVCSKLAQKPLQNLGLISNIPYVTGCYVSSMWLTCYSMLVTQSCLTLCELVYCSPPGSSVQGLLQARILEWASIPFSRESSNPGIEPGLLNCRQIVYYLSHKW